MGSNPINGITIKKDILNTWNIKRNAFELPLEVLSEAEINSN
jgi:hypothetical protein